MLDFPDRAREERHTRRRRLCAALFLTLSFFVVEVIGGLVSGSLALIADTIQVETSSAPECRDGERHP